MKLYDKLQLIVIAFIVICGSVAAMGATSKTVCYTLGGKSACFNVASAATTPPFSAVAKLFGATVVGSPPTPIPKSFSQVAGIYGYNLATLPPTPTPTPSPVPSPTFSPTPGAPQIIQSWTYSTTATGGEIASTIALPTGAPHQPINPVDTLLACVAAADQASGPTVTIGVVGGPPWTRFMQTTAAWNVQAWYSGLAGTVGGVASSATFSFSDLSVAQIWIFDITGTAGLDAISSATTVSTTPWLSTTGTATLTGLNDLGIICASLADSVLSASPPPVGYTIVNTSGSHISAANQNGNTATTYTANALITSATPPAQTVTWNGGFGTEQMIGQQAFMAPASPAATPAPGTCPTVPPLTNGLEYTGPFTPYGCAASPSPWTQTVPSTPNIATWSATLIGNQFSSGNAGTTPITIWPGASDFGYSLYYASATDPLVNATCLGGGGAGGCNNTDNGGFSAFSPTGICSGISSCTFKIRVPAGMRIPLSSGTDTRLIVIQPNGVQIDFYCFGCNASGNVHGSGAGGNWQTGDSFSMLAADNCGVWTTSTGWINANNGNTGAAGACEWAGAVTSNEIVSGYIPHALAATYACAGEPTGAAFVFPALGGGTQICTNGTNGVGFGPPLGGRLWYDNTCNATSAPVTAANFPNGLPGSGYSGWALAVLCAMNQYGSFFSDNGTGGAQIAGGVSIFPSGGEMFFAYGNDAWSRTVSTYGWFIQTNAGLPGILGSRYYPVAGQATWTPPGFTNAYFQAHFKWLDPCEAHVPRTC